MFFYKIHNFLQNSSETFQEKSSAKFHSDKIIESMPAGNFFFPVHFPNKLENRKNIYEFEKTITVESILFRTFAIN